MTSTRPVARCTARGTLHGLWHVARHLGEVVEKLDNFGRRAQRKAGGGVALRRRVGDDDAEAVEIAHHAECILISDVITDCERARVSIV